jgi:ketosteroid isomerase-like protein
MNNDMISRIIEIITKKNFGDYMAERLMKPLGMTSTSWIVAEKDLNRFTSIYLWKDNKLTLTEGKEPVQSAFPRGNGQMVSTAGDYMKFLLMMQNGGTYNGKRYLKKESVDMITADHLPPSIKLQVGATVFPYSGFGLSVAVSRNPDVKWKPTPIQFDNLFQHLPKGSYTWPGITNMYWWADPVNEVTGVVFSQLSNPGVFGNFQELTQTFYNDFFNVSETDQLLPIKSAAKKEVWEREVQFSIECAEIGIHQATLRGIADNGILFKPGPVNGKQYNLANKFPPLFFKTFPESVEGTLGGDMGFVTGNWELENNKPKSPTMGFGFFSTVWQKQNDGAWKVICATAVGGIKPEQFQTYSMGSHKWGENKVAGINNESSSELSNIESRYNNAIVQAGDLSGYFDENFQILRDNKLPLSINEFQKHSKESKTNNWKPMEAKVAKLGDKAFTYGSFSYTSEKGEAKTGYYFRFWKRDASNQWKIFMDMWN